MLDYLSKVSKFFFEIIVIVGIIVYLFTAIIHASEGDIGGSITNILIAMALVLLFCLSRRVVVIKKEDE